MQGTDKTEIKNNPTSWRSNDRKAAIELAREAQKKIRNKKLVQVNHKTWVYVDDNEKAIEPIRYRECYIGVEPMKDAQPVVHNGKIYGTVAEFAKSVGIHASSVYRHLQKPVNKYGVRYATVPEKIRYMKQKDAQ